MTNSNFKVNINFNLRKPKDIEATAVNAVIRFNNSKVVISGIGKIKPSEWRSPLIDGEKSKKGVRYNFPKVNAQNTSIISSLKNAEQKIDEAFNESTVKLDRYPETKEEIRDFQELCKRKVFNLPDPLIKEIAAEVKSQSLIKYTEKLKDDIKDDIRKKSNGQSYAKESYKSFHNLWFKLDKYREYRNVKDILFDDIDLDFYQDFREYVVIEMDGSPNYFGGLIKNLKTTMLDAMELGYHSNEKWKSKRFIKEITTSDTIYLNEKQLDVLFKMDLSSSPYLANARDLFLIGCYTGLRFSDFNTINESNIEGHFLKVDTRKTKKRVTIPISDNLHVILSRINDVHSITNQKINLYLKEIGVLVANSDEGKNAGFNENVFVTKYVKGKPVEFSIPFHTLISSHTARRSFATNMFKVGVPSLVIMAITGHKTERAFLTYIKADNDTMANIMMDFMNKSKKIKIMEVVNG